MTSAMLQWIALLTMTVDHIGYRIFPGTDVFRMVGRLAFPIFVFLLAEGFAHTSSRKRYLVRLAVFALLSEIPHTIFTHGARWRTYLSWASCGNIFFELALTFLALWCIQLGREKNRLLWLGTAACLVGSGLLGAMYGWYGVLMGVCFYLFREKRWLCVLALVILTALYCWGRGSTFQLYAIAATVPIYFYNGERGPRLPKYFSYIYYPAHLLVIYGIYCLI